MNNSNWPVDPENMEHGKYWQDGITVVAGCSHISAGCKNCWSADIEHRFRKHDLTTDAGEWTGQILVQDHLLKRCYSKKPKVIAFWNDVFHWDIPESFYSSLIRAIRENPQHVYLVLTKRPENIPACINELSKMSNLFLGVTVENMAFIGRIDMLVEKWHGRTMLSIEPLLEPIAAFNIASLSGFDWVVVGAESGPNKRRCDVIWIRSIVKQCFRAKVPVFVKQIHMNGRLTKDMTEWPVELSVRQTPMMT